MKNLQKFIPLLEKMNQPCLGLSPLLDDNTNVEFDCGENSNVEECPAFSYCHKGDGFSKCCPFPRNDGKTKLFL